MSKRIVAGCAVTGVLCAIAFAQGTNIKAGLWETAADMGNSMMGAIPEDRLARMTPEQRAQVQAMMKQSMGQTTTKVCYTEEQIRKGLDYNVNRPGSTCTSTLVSNDGSKVVREVSCDTGRGKTRGTVTYQMDDREHFNGLVQMHADVNGQSRDMTIKISGKWISSDCGDVKPHDYSK
jgi:hypothetical protein